MTRREGRERTKEGSRGRARSGGGIEEKAQTRAKEKYRLVGDCEEQEEDSANEPSVSPS
jgi:hypothetical protein